MTIIIPIKGTIIICTHCKDPFLTQRRDKKYCTNSCKQMAWIKRKPIAKKNVVALKKDGFLKRFFKAIW